MPIGLDIGTFNIIQARRDGDEIVFKREVNAFLDLSVDNAYMLNMLKTSGAPVVERGETAYILGKAAVELAYTMNREVNRPMYRGILSVQEKEAFNILSVIIRSMIGEISKEGETVCFSTPADAVNTATTSSYHHKVLEAILSGYKFKGKSLKARAINEGLAVVIAELGDKGRTGIGISFGAGMINLCYAMFSMPVVQFSRTDSGDWIDYESAKATGETATYINKRKEEIDLGAEPKDSIDRAIMYHYQLLIENSIRDISKGIRDAGSKANPGKPIDIVLAGGTASPKGFVEFFNRVLGTIDFPLEIGEVKLAPDHLYTVAKGCLLAAEASGDTIEAPKEKSKPVEKTDPPRDTTSGESEVGK